MIAQSIKTAAMTIELKMYNQSKPSSESAILSSIQQRVMDLQSEMYFLQKKSSLLRKIVGMSHFSNRSTDARGNDFQEEFFLLITQDFSSLQKDLETYLDELKENNLVRRGVVQPLIDKYRIIQQDWLNLNGLYRQLELQILEGVIRNYPISFI